MLTTSIVVVGLAEMCEYGDDDNDIYRDYMQSTTKEFIML